MSSIFDTLGQKLSNIKKLTIKNFELTSLNLSNSRKLEYADFTGCKRLSDVNFAEYSRLHSLTLPEESTVGFNLHLYNQPAFICNDESRPLGPIVVEVEQENSHLDIDGSIVVGGDTKVSKLIRVIGGERYNILCGTPELGKPAIVGYEYNQYNLRGDSFYYPQVVQTAYITYTVPYGVNYIRICGTSIEAERTVLSTPSLTNSLTLGVKTVYSINSPNVEGLKLANIIFAKSAQFSHLRAEVGFEDLSGRKTVELNSISYLIQLQNLYGLNEQGAYAEITHPVLLGDVYVEGLITQNDRNIINQKFPELDVTAEIELSAEKLAVHTVDASVGHYNPAVAIILQAQGYGALADVEDPSRGWYLTKEQAAEITSIDNLFAGVTSVADTNGIVSTSYIDGVLDPTRTYNFVAFDEFEFFTGVERIQTGDTKQIFLNCTLLNTIKFPSGIIIRSVSERGGYYTHGVFEGCSNLNIPVSRFDNVIFDNNNLNLFKGCSSLTWTTTPENLILQDGMFTNCISLNERFAANIPYTSDYIGGNVSGCFMGTNIREFSSSTITKIGKSMFKGTYLRSISAPNVTIIKKEAFRGTSISEISFPLLETVEEGAFRDTALTTITAPELTVVKGNAYNSEGSEGGAFLNCVLIENASFGNFTEVGVAAFCKASSAIFVSNFNECSIGGAAFYGIQTFENSIVTLTDCTFVDGSWYINEELISHIWDDVVVLHITDDTPPTLPNTNLVNNLQKIYVGDGSNAEHDNAILALYQSATNWSTLYTEGLIDTWYNYLNTQE